MSATAAALAPAASFGQPVGAGAGVDAGAGAGAAATSPVGTEVELTEPSALCAVMTTRSVSPRSCDLIEYCKRRQHPSLDYVRVRVKSAASVCTATSLISRSLSQSTMRS